MRFVSIAIFLFCIHVSMALMNASGVFITTVKPNNEWLDSLSQDVVKNQTYTPNIFQQTITVIIDSVKGLFYMVLTFGLSIIVLPYTFMQFGMNLAMATLLSAPFYMMYLFGWAQWYSSKMEKGMG